MSDKENNAGGGRIGKAPLLALGGVLAVVIITAIYTLTQAPPGRTRQGTAPGQNPRISILPPDTPEIIAELQATAVASEEAEKSAAIAVNTTRAAYNLPAEQDFFDSESASNAALEKRRREEARLAEYLAALTAETTVYAVALPAAQITGSSPGAAPGALPGTAPGPGTGSPPPPGTRAYNLVPGTVIRGALRGDINSEAPGVVIGQVTDPVYDSATGKHLLIERGSKLIGKYRTVNLGQSRVVVEWEHLVSNGGDSVSFPQPLLVSDAQGNAGLRGRVNRHLTRAISNSVLLSAAAAGAQLSQPQSKSGEGHDSGQIAAASLGQQFSQLGAETARQGLSVAPTITVASGTRFSVILPNAMQLPEIR